MTRTRTRSRSYRAFPAYYDAEYDGAPMLDRDVPFFLEHMPARSQRVLELCAGTGRAAIPIAQAGHRVVGVDYDSAMLKIARFKRDSVGLTDRQLHFVRSDVLRMKLPTRFDWAVIFFNTLLNFTTLKRLDRLLTNARQHLKPRGRLWIDIFNPNHEILQHDHIDQLDPATFDVPALDRTVHRETEINAADEPQLQHVTFHYHWKDRNKTHHEDQSFDMTYLFLRELQMLLERNGFRLLKVYGDYDRSIVTRHSPRQIAIARRR